MSGGSDLNPFKAADNLVSGAGDLLKSAGDTVASIVKNPLPVIETVALVSVGVDPITANAIVSAANGGNMEQIALSAAAAYAGQQIGEYAGSQVDTSSAGAAAAGTTVAQQELIKQIVSSSSGSAATMALRGGDFNQVLTSAVSASVGSYTQAELKAQGIDPKSVDGRLMANATTAATRAILNGKSVAEAIGSSAAATALNYKIQQGVDTIKANSTTYQNLASSFNDVKKQASDYFNNTLNPKQVEAQKQYKAANDAMDAYTAEKKNYDSYVQSYNTAKAANDVDTANGWADKANASATTLTDLATKASDAANTYKDTYASLTDMQKTYDGYSTQLNSVNNQIAELNTKQQEVLTQVGQDTQAYNEMAQRDATGIANQISDFADKQVASLDSYSKDTFDKLVQSGMDETNAYNMAVSFNQLPTQSHATAEVALLSPDSRQAMGQVISDYENTGDWETARQGINKAVQNDINSGYLKPQGDGTFVSPDGVTYYFNEDTGAWDATNANYKTDTSMGVNTGTIESYDANTGEVKLKNNEGAVTTVHSNTPVNVGDIASYNPRTGGVVNTESGTSPDTGAGGILAGFGVGSGVLPNLNAGAAQDMGEITVTAPKDTLDGTIISDLPTSTTSTSTGGGAGGAGGGGSTSTGGTPTAVGGGSGAATPAIDTGFLDTGLKQIAPTTTTTSQLNPLLFSLAKMQPTQQQNTAADPFSELALSTSLSPKSTGSQYSSPFSENALNTYAFAPSSAQQTDTNLVDFYNNQSPYSTEAPKSYATGGQVSGHPMGEPEFYSEGGLSSMYTEGRGDGTSDEIPAMVANNEFVMPADVVSALGNGSSDAGAKKLEQMVHNIRARARSTHPSELPPPAFESPLDYLKKA